MNSLRILYVDTDEVWRGGQEQLFSLMAGMKDRQHDIWLAAPPSSPLSERARRTAIPTLPFEQRSELSPMAVVRLWKILKRTEVDIIHLNTPRSIFSGCLASKLCSVPLRISSRRVNFPLNSWFSRLKYNWGHARVITVSDSIRQTLVEDGIRPELVSVIYEGVDVSWVDQLEAPPFARTGNVLIVGTVAYMSHEKGHRVLLEAIVRLVPKFPQVLFLFVGSGELIPELKERARALGVHGHVVFTGFRPDSEAFMKNFDLFCLPSLSEGLSSAILVAMAARLPVVATWVGGVPELVVDGKTGILVPPQDSEALAEALYKLLQYKELRENMGRAGRRRVREYFTLSRKLDQTEGLYFKLLSSARIR